MSKTKKAQRASQHIMQAMEHGMVDLVRNGFSPNESATIVGNAAIARLCVLAMPADPMRADELFKTVLGTFKSFTTPSLPTAPAAEPEKPVRPVIEIPETTDFPVEENVPKQERPRTSAEILYPKR